MNRLNNLIIKKTNKIISCKENSVSISFNCDNCQFMLIHYDNSKNTIISDKDKKCDYIITIKDNNKIALYIELKGNDLKQAFEQIKSTKEKVGNMISSNYGALVYKSIPKNKTNIQNIKLQAKKIFEECFIEHTQISLKYNSIENIISK
ncbi:hypothetical protein [Campylobacter hyointestinalis]|uniref:Uncharacterized protein n=1 Tax=Campylobacter hyointestinalis subsp. hyointestinalis TaxID=91352 RepID=A0A9W5AQC4_CAMHY|nr:hypothetical protein [Campylobacter hyointestinalis]CUU74267.1 Uncharacterised protein [Campylobacter hyointestinalis subsp. hyointestinalis]CUU82054.1 Uncharacterised protein [Campylobacter hyointestinalis subsp. hyointestinalis]